MSLLAGLTAVAHRGLALGGGVAGVTSVASIVSGDVLQCQSMFHIKRWHVSCQPGERQLTVELRAPGRLLAWKEYWLVSCQRPGERRNIIKLTSLLGLVLTFERQDLPP